MKRRAFLGALGGAFVSPFLPRYGLAQPAVPSTITRAAIVIGVDKAGDLPALRAAASGARTVERWLQSEGFFVQALVDDGEPIRAHMVHEAIARVVNPGTFDQLVIYFAGHGFLNAGSSEVWMLSDAPGSASEAVNLEASVCAARESGMNNVVFISDACRSTPDSLRSSRMQGYIIFPNLPASRPRRPDVDRFLATLPGKESNEIPVTESAPKFEGIYTSALLDAFRRPEENMVCAVGGVNVVPNRKLKAYLWREVPKRAQASAFRLIQKPESIIESEENTYIGRVAPDATIVRPPSIDTSSLITFRHVAELALDNAGVNVLSQATALQLPKEVVESSSENTKFWNAQNEILTARAPLAFETGSGINVVGIGVEYFVCGPRMRLERLSWPDMGTVIRVYPFERRPGSVVIGFEGGGGTVVAALPDFIASVVVSERKVVNVNYVPSMSSGGRWEEYSGYSHRIRELRSTVAASAQYGVFRIDGDRETRTRKARELADAIRVGKGFDPTAWVICCVRLRRSRYFATGALSSKLYAQ